MNVISELRICLAWWNTSLSPRGRPRASSSDQDVASKLIHLLIDTLHVDCLALGEVTYDDMCYLSNSCDTTAYSLFHAPKEGRLKFDTGLIYNRRRLKIESSKNITRHDGRMSLKLAQRIDLKIVETQENLHLYILHWPSRLWCHDRSMWGTRLRDSIDSFRNDCNYSPQILIVGDFNDEPFDKPLATCLRATRDRTLAMKDDSYFYNPFWRHLGETLPYSPEVGLNSICGTYFHRKGNDTTWRTFDQIVVSSSFLNSQRWFIDEEHTLILNIPDFEDSMRDGSKVFDHRPVITFIQRNTDSSSGGIS